MRIAKLAALWIGFLLPTLFPALAFGAPLTADTVMDTTLWVQTAAEYRAITEQTYALAAMQLPDIAKAPHAKPPTIVVDVDETILDNSAFQVHMLKAWRSYDDAEWDDWIAMRKAGAVPGAADFLKAAAANNIHVFYVTNRKCAARATNPADICPQQADTWQNLLNATGLNSIALDDVMPRDDSKGWTSEKASRRQEIEKKYEIVMLVGDQLSDFIEGTNGKSRTVRDQAEAANVSHWGHDWFILPNPMYGDYSRTDLLGSSKSDALHGY